MIRALASPLVVGAALVLAACDPPPLTVRYSLTDGDSQVCFNDASGMRATSCEDMTMYCPAVLSLRIVPPGDPTVPYASVCKRLQGAHDTLCAISRVDLPQPTVPVPEQVLEVQMAIFPESVVPLDPETGELVCPPVEFAATNLPVAALPGCTDEDPGTCPRVPAIGGRAYYYPGDTETVVKLGCTDFDLQLRTAACAGENSIPVKATVKDFDTTLSVDQAIANRLTVSIGEPTPLGTEYALFPQDTRELTRTAAAVPSWAGTIDFELQSTKCIVVLEDGAQSTSTLQCANVDPVRDAIEIGMTGVRLSKSTLTQILAAINQSSFPDTGLTIGIVLDTSDDPAGGLKVTATPPAGVAMAPTVQYLAADRMSANDLQTSTNGIFIVQTAPYGTLFSAQDANPVLGGNVQGKVTIVILRQHPPASG
ncbi:MAG: hypothetical protein HOV81_22980 [Kofleriaceae bacterium]|nr:hypothetical protein [Kofleriaceae bacterium]